MTGHQKTAVLISQNMYSIEEVVSHLQEKGFTVYHCRNGAEGVKLAKDHNAELIVLDISPDKENRQASVERTLTLMELNSDDLLSKITLAITTPGETPKLIKPLLKEMHVLTKPVQLKPLQEKIKAIMHEPISSILVVDDDESAREIMTAVAKKAGWNVTEAVNGREALEKMAQTKPSLMLLDLMMPEMDGFTVLSEMQKKQEFSDIPVIVVTAKELSQDERALLEGCSENILQKGEYTRQTLIEAIAKEV